MSCINPEMGQLLQDYFCDALSEAEAEQFENHLFTCETCRTNLKVMDYFRSLSQEDLSIVYSDPDTAIREIDKLINNNDVELAKAYLNYLIDHPVNRRIQSVFRSKLCDIQMTSQPKRLINRIARLSSAFACFMQTRRLLTATSLVILITLVAGAAYFYAGQDEYPPWGIWRLPNPGDMDQNRLKSLQYPNAVWPNGVWIWYDFSQVVDSGEVLIIRADGYINVSPGDVPNREPFTNPYLAGPDGRVCFPDTPMKHKNSNSVIPYPLFPDNLNERFASESDTLDCYALIGKFHQNDKPFVIGSHAEVIPKDRVQGIYLAINDDAPEDNTGYWKIEIYRLDNGNLIPLI
ncbi:zf-HC2 domain-containing protein [bacterium]|nr:zf-HC2 domain-containing protein [candidate division CSSED10-310 bacterium]